MSDFIAVFVVAFLASYLTSALTVDWVDVYVKDIPIQANYLICESQDSTLYSWDTVTATCENGFQFDLIKEPNQ